MKLRDWLKDLNDQVEQDASLLDLPIVTSADDEGNYFNEVFATACKGFFEGGEFTQSYSPEANSVCLN